MLLIYLLNVSAALDSMKFDLRNEMLSQMILDEVNRLDESLNNLEKNLDNTSSVAQGTHLEKEKQPTDAVPKEEDLKLIARYSEDNRKVNYLTMGLAELFVAIGQKEIKYIRSLLKNAGALIDLLNETGELKWLRGLRHFIVTKIELLAVTEASLLKARAMEYTITFHNPQLVFGDDRELLDFANGFFYEEDLKIILDAVEDVKTFPRISKSNNEICKEVFDAYMEPFKRAQNESVFENFYSDLYDYLSDKYPAYFQ